MTVNQTDIAQQKNKVFGEIPTIKLVEPCRINKGILRFEKDERKKFIHLFSKKNSVPTFFIPASGSGSRMFQFLFDFLTKVTDENRGLVTRFLNHIEEFAFYRKIDFDTKNLIAQNKLELEDLVKYVIGEEGLNLSKLPKGLVPFHNYGYFILNPFQEQALQAAKIGNGAANVHFTVNPIFEKEIKNSIHQVCAISGYNIKTSFSVQCEETNSYTFTENGNVYPNEHNPLRRPAGHGALLSNLNKLDAGIIFIKNIDNIQHEDNSLTALNDFRFLGGILTQLTTDLKSVVFDGVVNKMLLSTILEKYQLTYDISQIENQTNDELLVWINRPRRVCGMVKNEGQAGGGPFWVEDSKGEISKQIVEKAQISSTSSQNNIMVKSSHFNPVMLACDTRDLDGKKHDLSLFRDDNTYFVVTKNQQGDTIRFAEQPGLWNGSMADWTTVFVEVSSNSFSPVKTVLDLLNPLHINSI
jgi:hypothetical protein